MTYSVITNKGNFYVSDAMLTVLLDDCTQGLQDYIEAQADKSPLQTTAAWNFLNKQDLSNSREWFATIIMMPFMSFGDDASPLAIIGFANEFSNKWFNANTMGKTEKKAALQGVVGLVHIVMKATGLFEASIEGIPGSKWEMVVPRITENGFDIYETLEIEYDATTMADMRAKPSASPIIYDAVPWGSKLSDEFVEAQSDEVNDKFIAQAEAASSVPFIIDAELAEVYLAWKAYDAAQGK